MNISLTLFYTKTRSTGSKINYQTTLSKNRKNSAENKSVAANTAKVLVYIYVYTVL